MRSQAASTFPVLVQFEDIDVNGFVHHPNYLKYLERARSQGLKDCGYSVEMLMKTDIALAVSDIQAHYLRPALVGQDLFVVSCILSVGKSVVKLRQSINLTLPLHDELSNAGDRIHTLSGTLFWAQLSLVCVDLKTARPRSLPLDLKQALKFSDHLLSNDEADDSSSFNHQRSPIVQ